MGADKHGNKELVAVQDGFRESKISWKEMLLDLKQRGPKLAIGDGSLGFWAALDEVFGQTKRQRCWVHKTANILDKMPKVYPVQGKINDTRDVYGSNYKIKNDRLPEI
jgi:transposase-like protein